MDCCCHVLLLIGGGAWPPPLPLDAILGQAVFIQAVFVGRVPLVWAFVGGCGCEDGVLYSLVFVIGRASAILGLSLRN